MDLPLSHRVRPGERVDLSRIDPRRTGPYADKDDPRVQTDLAASIARLVELQQRLYASGKGALLVVLQALDAAGKDGTLRVVVGPLDSRGVHVWPFKAPTSTELAHDYLWRIHAHAPAQGEMAFFNRSHYEDVLVVRVLGLAPEERWKRRFDHINAFERMLADEGTTVVKIFLHVSKEEQRQRLQERVDVPEKRWKFDPHDLDMRARWDDFQRAYEDVLSRCSTEHAPWYVVPADRKWYRNLAVAEILVAALERIDPRYPEPTWDPAAITIR